MTRMNEGVMVIEERPARAPDRLPELVAHDPCVSDEELVRAACRDRDEFAQLYLRYADRVYRFALARTRSTALADDIVGDTMLAAIEGLHNFDPSKGSFAGWLFTIASRRVSDRERRQRQFWNFLSRRPPAPADFEQEEDALASTLRGEQRTRVRDAIGRLSERHQQIVLLRYVAELPIRDISEMLDISEGAVKMRLNRALQHLADDLGEERVETTTARRRG
jgi:RNA polymerase sigma factor (sigma-70 family)